jgi:hypothetical protein
MIVLMLCPILRMNEAVAEEQHAAFTALLSKHVKDGRINYTNLCKDQRLNEYTDQLNKTQPDAIQNEKDRFAFWLNTYNAYSLQAICKQYPIKSINELNFGGLIVSVLLKKSVWDRPFVMVNHKAYTLREVDHEILRPLFKDPRIQFAIACGAIGCAPSRSEAYEGDKINAQLDDQARRFINDPSINSFDSRRKVAKISTLFNWSKKDFGSSDKELLLYLASYLPDDLKGAIMNDPMSWKIIYSKYDLTLNDTKEVRL